MYSLQIIETDSYLKALIWRAIMETAGFPTVAATIETSNTTMHCALTACPHSFTRADGSIALLVEAYDALGDAGLERVRAVKPRAELCSVFAIPEGSRDAVRRALLECLRGACSTEHATVTSEPALDAVVENHDPGDEDTKPNRTPHDEHCGQAPHTVTECPWDNWKPGRHFH